jgi:glycerophosphoryl diester phosphodiesterase
VGDNIYEYNDLNYPDATQKLRTQVTDPPTEIVSLDDYRRRYRLYRNDPSMQLLGATAPLIMTADDHEYTNNPWMTGAQNHNVAGSSGAGFDNTKYPEGDFYVRITNALQAMYEYNPIREQHSVVYSGTTATGSAAADLTAVTTASNTQYPVPITDATVGGYISGNAQTMPGAPVTNITALTRYRMFTLQRAFTFSNVVTVALTEDRVSYRTSANSKLNNGALSPIGPTDCPSGNVGAFYVANDPLCSPVAQAAVALGMATRTAAGTGISMNNPNTWTQAQIANLSSTFLNNMMYNPMYYNNASQHIIGTTPTNWLGTTFAASKTAGVKFQVWASQTVFMVTEATDTYNATISGRASSQSLASAMNPYSTNPTSAAYSLCTVLGAGCAAAWASMPWNVDGWDGYNYERQQVLNALAQANNPIVNSGDAHGFWLGSIKSSITTGTPSVVEFAGGSITSQGWGDYFPALNGVNGAPVMGYTLNNVSNAFLNVLEDGFTIANAPNGMVASRHLHGALVFKATAATYIGQVFTISSMNSSSYVAMCDYAYSVAAATPGVMTSLASGGSPGCVSTMNGMNGAAGTVPGTFNGATNVNGGYPTTASAPPPQTVSATPIDGLHALRWFTGGGGHCIPGMSVADCSYRKLLMRHIKTSMQTCANPLTTNMMSISHRGAPLVYPEHTMEGYQQAINDGAGWIECDTVPTKDMQLVCRHSTCDLASTTNVLSIPSLSAKCTVPGSKCCTYDFSLLEYSSLCGISQGASGPHLQANSWSNGVNSVCNAHPATLVEMAAMTIAQGARLIPEQKNCDLMCQAKLAAYAPNGITGCTTGVLCQAAVSKISDAIITALNTATSNDNTLSILQTFELNVAKDVATRYPSQQVAYLYEFHGQGTQTTQADYYLGSYAAGYTTIGGVASPAMGSSTCAWCVNGTSPGGWYDVLTLGAAPYLVDYAAPSTADLVRPVGGLMVASDWAKFVANTTAMKLIGWTLERSTAIFGSSPAAPNDWPSGSYSTFDSTGWAYQQHAGASSLDYEDMLFMLYALRYDVPDFSGVFSDWPASSTAFFNCVPKFEAAMPVSSNGGWADSTVPYTTVVRDTSSAATPAWQVVGYGNESIPLSGTHVWRMFSGGGGMCGVAQQDVVRSRYVRAVSHPRITTQFASLH